MNPTSFHINNANPTSFKRLMIVYFWETWIVKKRKPLNFPDLNEKTTIVLFWYTETDFWNDIAVAVYIFDVISRFVADSTVVYLILRMHWRGHRSWPKCQKIIKGCLIHCSKVKVKILTPRSLVSKLKIATNTWF